MNCACLRLVFTGVGVVIRSVQRYDLVKIKPTESEAEGYSAYDLLKNRLSESQALFWYQTVIGEHENKHCDWLVLPLLPPAPTTQFSLDHKRRVISGVGRKWKRSDSSDSDSVELMTRLTTLIFDFHWVIRALTTLTPTPTLTPPFLKTSLYSSSALSEKRNNKNHKSNEFLRFTRFFKDVQ